MGLAAAGQRRDVPAVIEQFQAADLAPVAGSQLAPGFVKRNAGLLGSLAEQRPPDRGEVGSR
jgi:hypothetical protein